MRPPLRTLHNKISPVRAIRVRNSLVIFNAATQTPPDLPVEHVVPVIWRKTRCVHRKRNLTTVRDFFRHLAELVGFLMRQRDNEPSWTTPWRGLDKLTLAVRGHLAINQKCG